MNNQPGQSLLAFQGLPYLMGLHNISAIGMMPYSLVNGTEAVHLLEIEITTLWISTKDLLDQESFKGSHLVELEELDERRLLARQHLEAFCNRSCLTYEKKVKHRAFHVGDKVLNLDYVFDRKGKFVPKWLGPFVILEDLQNGTYHISTLDG
eukprot:Gb_05313 [translate_table: standard]